MLKHFRTWFAALATIAVIASVLVLATRADGREATQAFSNDGGAWLVDRSQGGIAHVEFESGEHSVTILIEDESGSKLSVKQSDMVTLVYDQTASVVSVVDNANATRRSKTIVPLGSVIYPLETDLMVYDPTTQRLWHENVAEFGQADDVAELDDLDLSGIRAVLASQNWSPVLIDYSNEVIWLDEFSAEAGASETTNDEQASRVLPTSSTLNAATMAGDVVVAVMGSEWFGVTPDVGVWDIPVSQAPQVGSLQRESSAYPTVAYLADDGSSVAVDILSGEVSALSEPSNLSALERPIWHEGCLYALRTDGEVASAEVACLDGRSSSSLELGNDISPEAEMRLVNGRVIIDQLDGSGWLYSPDLVLDEIKDFSGAFDETEDFEDESSEETEQKFDQTASDAALTDADGNLLEENEAPVAEDDEVSIRLGRPAVVDVLANDFDANGDVLLIDEIEILDGSAKVEISPDRSLVQVSDIADLETVRFRYTISDGRGPESTDSAIATVKVLPLTQENNNPPIPEIDRLWGAAGTVLTVNLTNNDHDPDGDSIILKSVSQETDVEILSVHPNGDVVVVLPNRVIEGEIKVPYLVADEWGSEAEGELQVTVRLDESNVAPDARNDFAITQVGQRVVIDLLANDVDGDGDVLRATQARPLQEGDIGYFATTESGEFTFEPNAVGTYLFEYDATDRRSKDTAIIRVEVGANTENRPPIAIGDEAALALGETRLIRALDNDADPDGDLVGVVAYSRNANLDILLEQGIGFFVTMKAGADTAETFQYRISDGKLESDWATVVLARSDTVFQNAPPVAVEDRLRVRAGRRSSLPVLRNDYDPEGGSLEVTAVNSSADDIGVEIGAHGQWIVVDVPATQILPFNVVYTITDDAGNTDAATAEIAIVPNDETNRPPTARKDEVWTLVEQPVFVEVLLNDTDPENDPITLTEVVPTPPKNGTATFDGEANGFLYEPAPGFSGTDTFSYVIRDSEGDESIGHVHVAVMPRPLTNTPPTANPDLEFEFVSGAGEVTLDVLANDFDLDGDPLTVIDVAGSELAKSAEVAVLFDVPSGLEEDATFAFSYTIADGRGGTDTTEVVVSVVADYEPIPPIAVDDSVGPLKQGDEFTVDVLANDSDPDGDVDLLLVSLDSPSEFAQISPEDPQKVLITAPAASFQVSYTITDKDGLSASAVIEVEVVPNLAPVVQSPINLGEFYTDEEVPQIDLSKYVTDPEGDPLVFSNVAGAFGGSVILERSAQDARLVNFTPTADFKGKAGFSFTVTDSFENQASGVVEMTLLGASNKPPVGEDTSIEVEAGITQPFDLQSMFGDPDVADVLTIELLSEPTGDITLARSGDTINISAPITAQGSVVVVQVQATDIAGLSANANLTIDLVPSRVGPPIANPDDATSVRGKTTPIYVTRNDINTLGSGELKVIAVSSADGQVTIGNPPTYIEFTPNSDVIGQATMQYRIQDDRGTSQGEADGLVTALVYARPDAPAGLNVKSSGPKEVSLTWQAPANNGAILDSYEIRVNPDSGSSTIVKVGADTPSHRFTNLTPGTEYRFEVRAENAVDFGDWSALSSPVKPDAVAPPPGTAKVTFVADKPGALHIKWNEPPKGNYSAIGRYFLEISGCKNETIDVGLATEYTWEGLENGVKCSFRSYGENGKVRDGAEPLWSAQSEQECPVGVVGQPSAPTAVRGDKQAEITWAAPANPDCQDIIEYEIRRIRDGNLDESVTAAFGEVSKVFGGLQNGSSYQFDIRARNRQGWGEYSVRSSPVIPCGVPLAPGRIQSVARGDQMASFVAGTEANANGCTVASYDLRFQDGGQRVGFSSNLQPGGTYSVEQLTNGTQYQFSVRGVNEIGPGEWSEYSDIVTPAGLPQGGTLVGQLLPNNEYRWLASGADGNGAEITGYTISGDAAIAVSSSSTEGISTCRNQQANICKPGVGEAPLKEAVCYQEQQSLQATAYATNSVGNGQVMYAHLDLPGCPNIPAELQVTPELVSTTQGRFAGASDYGTQPGVKHWVEVGSLGSDPSAWIDLLDVNNHGSFTNRNPGESDTFKVWACNELGCRSSAGISAEIPPPPTVSIRWNGEATSNRGTCKTTEAECQSLWVEYSGFPAGQTFKVVCRDIVDVHGWPGQAGYYVTGPSGSWDTTGHCIKRPGLDPPTWVTIGDIKSNEIHE